MADTDLAKENTRRASRLLRGGGSWVYREGYRSKGGLGSGYMVRENG
jgi:hypothetical protein